MPRRGGLEQVCPNIPNLTEEQSEQISELRTAHLSEMQSFRDQIDVNRAEHRALMRGGGTLDEINSNIDERANVRSLMEKKRAAHLQSIRNLLTEEQRVWFDAADTRPGAFMRAAPGRGGMRQAAPYGRGRGAYGPRGGRGFRRGF